ncbi:polysaccharide biosynthesis tyrosine autokinase [Sphaerospermopsis aphanizomenoides BCCUSP55]|uniref:GumC family protein n=1 Tax=Sphaerospermopsis aphanizomenoides TaxID=459663 RepID=UPI0019065DD3|nr:polysaccharide biosynthesis tyrosine autokinase [Sphaerospermopsis aphanizomenoides]MBK1988478.1 polysaccharide biosynthesis tyrosine autokinase [Sphaerospermopsis aphanizomenoides BCCUSP55]
MESKQEDQNLLEFQNYSLVFKKYWLVIVTVIAFVFGLTGLLTFIQKPIYEAKGKLLLKQSDASSLAGLTQKVGGLTGLSNTSNPVDTEVQIIRSNPIVQKTIDRLKLKNKQGNALTIEEFIKKLKVTGIRDTDVMELTYQSNNATEAAAIVNTLMKIYWENNILINRTETTSAKEFLSKQLPQIENRVAQAEADLRYFKDKNQIVSLEAEANLGVQEIKNLLSDIFRQKAQLEAAKSRSIGLQNQLNLNTQKAFNLSTISQSPGVQQVLTEYQKVQDDLAVTKTRLTDEHPTVKNLISKEKALKQQLEKRVGDIVYSQESIPEKNLQIGQLKQTLTDELVQSQVNQLALATQISVLQNAFLSSQARLRMLPQLEQQQRSLERRLQVAQATYQQALKQLQEMEVAEKQKVGNVRIVSEALIPDKPISPRISLNLALGGFLGVLLGIGVALLLEAMDKSLKTVEEAKQLLGYPLLGSIPRLGHKEGIGSELPVRDNPYSSASAAFEMLMTNLNFTLSDKELRVILVTSSMPNEGKSFVAANLAVAKAQMGCRVLLVDADMRRPRQHEIWELPNVMGLSNLLVGQGELAKTAQVMVGLELLTSGTIPPNPVALINSQRMDLLIKEYAKDYNFVIIDTAPLSIAAETQILGKLVDGMLLVVRPGMVDSRTAIAAKSLVEQSGQQVLGMVVNGVANDIDYGYYSYQQSSQKSCNKKTEKKLPNIRVS